MTYAITWEPPAIDAAARFLADDPAGLGTLFDAIDQLGADPRPETSFPFGSPDLRRLRIGPYRAFYEISDQEQTVVITHIGRSG